MSMRRESWNGGCWFLIVVRWRLASRRFMASQEIGALVAVIIEVVFPRVNRNVEWMDSEKLTGNLGSPVSRNILSFD